VDHVSETDPVDGVLLVDQDYLTGKRVFAQLVCSFRYGREEDETLGLSFKKELTLADEQIFPPPSGSDEKNGLTRLQERLLKKLGTSSIPFTLTFPRHSPTSVTLAPNADDPPGCLPCGVEYYIRCYVLEAGAKAGTGPEICGVHDHQEDSIRPNQTRETAMHSREKRLHVFTR